MIGSWHTEEIYMAEKYGYIIEEIYQVWDYEKSYQYNPEMDDQEEFFAGKFFTFFLLFICYYITFVV